MASLSRIFLTLGGVSAALAIVLGAFAAHALKARLDERMLEIFETAVHYHLYHSLGLLAVGLLALKAGEAASLRWSGWLMVAGVLLFSGSLYCLALTGARWPGAIAPLGGAAFIAAWLAFAFAAWSALS